MTNKFAISTQEGSGAALGSATSADAVLPNATSGDDNSSSDADPAPLKAASPVFGPTGQEPPPAVPDAPAPPDPAAPPADPAAEDSDNLPIFAGCFRSVPVDISNYLTWSPDNWNDLDFSSIKLPPQGEHLATLRSPKFGPTLQLPSSCIINQHFKPSIQTFIQKELGRHLHARH